MKRYWILASAMVMQMCPGATYSGSVHVESIREPTGLLVAAAGGVWRGASAVNIGEPFPSGVPLSGGAATEKTDPYRRFARTGFIIHRNPGRIP